MLRFIIGLILGIWIGVVIMCLFIAGKEDKKC